MYKVKGAKRLETDGVKRSVKVTFRATYFFQRFILWHNFQKYILQ
jgi:hypothetical protein